MLRDVLRDLARRLAELGPEERVVEPADAVEVRDQELRREKEPRTREQRDRSADAPVVAPVEHEVQADEHEHGREQELPVPTRSDHDRHEEADEHRPEPEQEPPLIASQSKRDEESEHDDRERDVFLAAQRDHRGNGEPTPSSFARGPVREEQRTDRDCVGMEELPHQPLVRRVQQECDRERDTAPSRTQQVASEQEDRDCAARLCEHLHREQELDATARAIEGREHQEERVHVVTEQIETAHGDERIAKLRK